MYLSTLLLCWVLMACCFFFSSRRRHTRCSRDWSSDVCSSELALKPPPFFAPLWVFGQRNGLGLEGWADCTSNSPTGKLKCSLKKSQQLRSCLPPDRSGDRQLISFAFRAQVFSASQKTIIE